MSMGGRRRAPGWVVWVMERLMTPKEVEEALSELDELHAHWEASAGRREADRRYRAELRRYPVGLLGRWLRAIRLPEPGLLMSGIARNLRGMSRAPVLTSAIVITVGLGIGGCTAIFAVADVLFLRPLPYPEPDRLVWIYTDNPPYRFNFSVVDLQALREQQTSFEQVAAFQTLSRTFVADDVVERLSVWAVSPEFFELLGVAPLAGRTPAPEEGAPGASATVLVTAGFATTNLGVSRGDMGSVIGTNVRLDDVPHEVIGVLPERIGPMGGRAQVFVTQQLEAPARRGPFFQRVVGRLADGVDPGAAAQELRAINRRLFPVWQSSYQDEDATWGMAPLGELLHGDADRLVLLLMGSVSLLLVLATTNGANLLLTRVRSRRRELSVRAALGASRSRVIAHLLAESAVLAAAGAFVGLVLARGAIALLPVLAGSYLPRLGEVVLHGRPLAFAALLAMASGLFFGLLSAFQGSPKNPLPGLEAGGGRSSTPSPGAQRSQRILVAAQIALAVPLLTGAGLLATTLRNLQRADPGFETGGLVTARISLAESRYPDGDERRQLWWELEERVRSIAGVLSVGMADSRPPVEAFNYNNYDLEDEPTPAGQNQPVAAWVSADEGYLETLGIPLREGRMLEEADELPDAPEVVLVDERWARRHFPGESAVGRRLREGGATSGPWTTVVGVVGEVPYAGLGGEAAGTVYAPWTSFVQPFLVARVRGEPENMVAAIREEVRGLDPTAPITDVETGETLIRSSLTEPRHLTLLLSAFSTVALALAVIGLYGVTAHSVQSRRADIAVRLALGGSPGRVLGQVVRNVMATAVVGLLIGGVAAPGFTRLMAGLLYGVGSAEPAMLSGVVALLGAISLAACAVPAWRAVRVSPGTGLREE